MSTYATWLALSAVGLLIGGAIILFWPQSEQHTPRHRETGSPCSGAAPVADRSAPAAGEVARRGTAAGGSDDPVGAAGPADKVTA